jgi:1-acyl-sn-glycerol-3-phosphate acyltransferase
MTDLVYHTQNFVGRCLLRAFANWRVEGIENVPKHGPLLVVANHLSNIDPGLLGSGVPLRMRFLAKSSLFQWGLGFYLRKYGAFPADRNGRDLEAFRWARDLLRRDGVIAMFPESTRNPEGMGRAVPGAALLAIRTRARILPVGISGSSHLGPVWRIFFPTGNITVRIGRPFSLPEIDGKVERGELQSLADSIMYHVADLIPKDLRGVYAQSDRGPADK